MAFEIRVTAELVDLSPTSEEGFSLMAEDAGVLIRSATTSTLIADPHSENPAADAMVIARSRLQSMADEVLMDARGQLEIITTALEREESQ